MLALAASPTEATLPPDLDPIVAVLLDHPAGYRAVLVLDATIASALVERTLGGEANGLDGAVAPLRDFERGVLTYALARWLSGSSSRFVAAGVLSSPLAVLEALGPPPHRRWPLDVQLGAVAGCASLWLPAGLPPPDLPRRLPTWASELPIELRVRASSFALAARTLADLRAGDVVLPDGMALMRTPEGIEGDVWLRPRGGTHAWKAVLSGGALRIGEERETITVALERSGRIEKETGVKDGERVLETLGETPVTLSLELARFSLPLGELASLGPGEIVRTGAPIGERVTLRAGERVVAIGELVEVEGEIGVRILELG